MITASGLACLIMASSASAATSKTAVLYYGDSLAREAQPFFIQTVQATSKAKVIAHAFPGTAPCDFYAQMKKDVRSKPGALVVISFYGNLLTHCVKKSSSKFHGSWYNTYQNQFASALDNLNGAGNIWVAVAPIAKATGISRKNQARQAALQAAGSNSSIQIFDAGAAVEAPGGLFATWLPCLLDETCNNPLKPGYNQVRSNDGLHFCPGVHSVYYLQCSKYEPGAIRYGRALAEPVVDYLNR